MSDWFGPFQYPFMANALLASILIGITCALLGVHVVQRRMAFVGDAMAHTTLPGLVIAHLAGWNLSLSGLLAAITMAILIAWVSNGRRLSEDTAIGVVYTAMFALGVVLMSRAKSYRDLTHMLFGNVLAITATDLAFIGSVSIIVLAALILFHKEMVLSNYDPTQARAIGIPVDRMRLLLLILLAMAVVTGIQAVGVILTNALLVTPAATASLLAQSFVKRMALATLMAVIATFLGLYLSFLGETSSGASIVLACTAQFVIATAWRWLRSNQGHNFSKS